MLLISTNTLNSTKVAGQNNQTSASLNQVDRLGAAGGMKPSLKQNISVPALAKVGIELKKTVELLQLEIKYAAMISSLGRQHLQLKKQIYKRLAGFKAQQLNKNS